MPTLTPDASTGLFVRTQVSAAPYTVSLAPQVIWDSFPLSSQWQVSGSDWSAVDTDRAQCSNTTGANDFLNLIGGIQQSAVSAVTFRVIAEGSGIQGAAYWGDYGIQLILTDSGGLAGTILGQAQVAFPVGTFGESQYSVTVTPSAPAYWLYAYIFARNNPGTLTVRQAEVFQASGAAATDGYWQSAPMDAYQIANLPIASGGTLAPLQWGWYYGDLSNVDGRYSVAHAIAALSQWPRVVISEPGQLTTTRQTAVMQGLLASGIHVYGYADAGIGEASRNGCIPLAADITAIIDRCAANGYAGVMLDGAGYDYGVPRAELNYLAGYAHGKGLYINANAYFGDDVTTSTVNAQLIAPPTAGPTLTAVADASSTLAAGTYEVAFTYTCYGGPSPGADNGGETTIGPTSSVTITAGQAIAVAQLTGIPDGVQGVRLYCSTVAGGTTLGLAASGVGDATTIAAPPSTTLPPTSNTAYTANPNGTATALGSGDWLTQESFFSRSDDTYDQRTMAYYQDAITNAHAVGVQVIGLAYALSTTPLVAPSGQYSDQITGWYLAAMLGFDAYSYMGALGADALPWGPAPAQPIGSSLSGSLVVSSPSPPTWQQATDAGTIWYTAPYGGAGPSAGAFASPSSLQVSVAAPAYGGRGGGPVAFSAPNGRVTTATEQSADLTTWVPYNAQSPARYIRQTWQLQTP